MTTISPALAFPVFAPQRRKISGLATLSLTFGILQFLLPFIPTSLATIPLGINALHQSDADSRESRAVALAGLTFSVAHFVVYVALFVWLLA
ncbi:hypothetical protein A5634_23475 [Mycobacterium asiaticum]|uniref:DUF4190 domain-containing protein n=1 Tax=Mycobacterium asiaticum TaxID=1790 RepID=A0A1A3P0G9_MYCAS|nr:hypothetical protein [Mycobacterium asiaticum]OBK27155.1 hypothetical protein A5634_23475 [Mycobacterium asiaticum]